MPVQLDEARLDRVLDEWGESPTTGVFGDILAFSFDANLRPRVVGFAKAAIASGFSPSAVQKHFVDSLSAFEHDDGEPSLSAAHLDQSGVAHVAELRRVLRANPANPLAMLDLAQHQVTTGKGDLAERTLRSALALSPDSRIVLRTLARMYVHRRAYDQAHQLIARHPRTASDPWLMATEIALAEVAGTVGRFAKKGARFAKESGANPASLSELTGALGGLELGSGNLKRARELFRLALISPNDNVVAQAVTNQKALGIALSEPAQKRVIGSAQEAQTLLAWESFRTEVAEKHALLWHYEEPFSSRPLQFLTTLYAASGKYSDAEKLAKRGLIADPTEPSLLSNLAYVLANRERFEEAESALRQLSRVAANSDRYDAVVLATSGLIALRKGDFAFGDRLYSEALEMFRGRRQDVLEAICRAYYARAAFDAGHPDRLEILASAKELYEKKPSADSAVVLAKLDSQIAAPDQTPAMRRLSQWVFDQESNTLTEVRGLTAPGAPALVASRPSIRK